MADSIRALAVLGATFLGANENESVTVVLPRTWVECLVFVAAGVAFAARRFPLPALGVAAVLDALPYWLPIGGAGYHLAVLIAVYMVVSREPPRRSAPAFVALVIVQVGLMARDMDWQWTSFYVASIAATLMFAAVLGSAARARSSATEALKLRAQAAEHSREADRQKLLAEDRLRIARDLHDSVAHQIAVVSLNAGVASRSLSDQPREAENALATIREASRSVIASISALLANLRDGQTEERDPHYGLDDLQELVEEFRLLTPSMTVDIVAHEHVSQISPVLYGAVQEALTNAYKHGDKDAPVTVVIRIEPGAAHLEVRNVPAGPPATTPGCGFGLRGMRERVTAAGGGVDVQADEATFDLRVKVPDGGGVL